MRGLRRRILPFSLALIASHCCFPSIGHREPIEGRCRVLGWVWGEGIRSTDFRFQSPDQASKDEEVGSKILDSVARSSSEYAAALRTSWPPVSFTTQRLNPPVSGRGTAVETVNLASDNGDL